MTSRTSVLRRNPPDSMQSVLVLSDSPRETDDLFSDLRHRPGIHISYASSVAEAKAAIERATPALVIISPEISASSINQLLALMDQLQPNLPVIAIRNTQAEQPDDWTASAVGVLRCPLLPEALGRSVEVVLRIRAS